MILPAFGVVVAICTILAIRDWRTGFRLAILIGIAQDPIRKLIPDTPAILAVASVPVWLTVFAGAFRRAQSLRAFQHAHFEVWSAARFFVWWLMIPTAFVLTEYGLSAWSVAAIGLFGYVAPIAALATGFSFGKRPAEVRLMLRFLVVVGALATLGTWLQFSGRFSDWSVLGTDALGAKWYRYGGAEWDLSEGYVVLLSGFFRSPDIMGWHAATVLIGALTLVAIGRGVRRFMWLGPAALGAASVLLSGRRKAVLIPLVWGSVFLVRGFKPGRVRQLAITIVGAAMACALLGATLSDSRVRDYYAVAETMILDGPSRFAAATWQSVWVTYLQNGLFGLGVGLASQGRQHVTTGVAETWQESGPSKLMVEVGLPGLFLVTLLAVRLVHAFLRTAQQATADREAWTLRFSLIAFAVANAASFTVSHQTYGDTLIVVLSSAFAGMALGNEPPQSTRRPAIPPRSLSAHPAAQSLDRHPRATHSSPFGSPGRAEISWPLLPTHFRHCSRAP